ncbi:ACP phosphodiesterase [Granulosicoccus antarcticus]|uniref:Acyl carrier protein phosphodiesterase n=1 Tax=Granulosicoccus antarcticus IMCC3135 TaxID=1192854 RepID=A0A2Z2NYK0_9GAMM|nr:ACP phosphodiesterase [Granulosicoccus antarcticus]ASJ72224.1 Acyl carrier protein phosphodiesterase [Granulosicoccus antarcticus IMCC3135]
MNFLAHTLLGFENADLIAGQVCGDFVRGSQLQHFPAGVEAGIRLHRHLDVFTDSHPALQAARGQMNDVPYRFSGIVIDVLFDHFLARQWSRFSQLSLSGHASSVHAALALHEPLLPPRLLRFMTVLESERILERNVDLSAIKQTLARLSRRSERFAPLAIDVEHLSRLVDHLQGPFESFHPDLQVAARRYLEVSFDSHILVNANLQE